MKLKKQKSKNQITSLKNEMIKEVIKNGHQFYEKKLFNKFHNVYPSDIKDPTIRTLAIASILACEESWIRYECGDIKNSEKYSEVYNQLSCEIYDNASSEDAVMYYKLKD